MTSVTNVRLIVNAKAANSSITINGTAVSLGGSVTAGTDWQAVVVADGSTQLTAVVGRGYFLDTNLGVIDVKLPASPSRGDTFVFADYGNNFSTNRVIIDTGGKLIDSTVGGGQTSGFVIRNKWCCSKISFCWYWHIWLSYKNEVQVSALTAVSTIQQLYDATGGTVTTSGDFKTHVFAGDGCFVVSDNIIVYHQTR